MSKVAYCLSGEARGLDVWESHLNFIINPNNCDVFFYTWKRFQRGPCDHPFPARPGWFPYVYSNFDAISVINPKLCIIEDKSNLIVDPCPEIRRPMKLLSKYDDVITSEQAKSNIERDRVFFQWYGWKKVFKSLEGKEKYDVVIKARTDLFYNSQLPFDLGDLEEGFIYIPEGQIGGGYRPEISLCDLFALGKYSTMEKYFNVMDYAAEYLKQNVPLIPELMLKHHLDEMGLKIINFPLDYKLHRTY